MKRLLLCVGISELELCVLGAKPLMYLKMCLSRMPSEGGDVAFYVGDEKEEAV